MIDHPGDVSKLLTALVAATLDVDEGNVEFESALHALARAAWEAGWQAAHRRAD